MKKLLHFCTTAALFIACGSTTPPDVATEYYATVTAERATAIATDAPTATSTGVPPTYTPEPTATNFPGMTPPATSTVTSTPGDVPNIATPTRRVNQCNATIGGVVDVRGRNWLAISTGSNLRSDVYVSDQTLLGIVYRGKNAMVLCDYTVEEDYERWLQIKLEDGTTGWIAMWWRGVQYARIDKTNDSVIEVTPIGG